MRNLNFALCFQLVVGILLLAHMNMLAQIDEECVIPYVFNVNNATCPGAEDGNATFSSPACPCMTSGCTFEWSNGETFHTATDLAAGYYSITVTHPDGCFAVDSVLVQEPPQMVNNVERLKPSCYGSSDGSINLDPNPNAGPLQYRWSDGQETAFAENLSAGDYEVTITNTAGCENYKSFVLEDPEMISVVSDTKDSCQGDSSGEISVEATGAHPPFAYLWNDPDSCTVASLSNVSAGIYTVTITDANDCQVSLTRVVSEEEVNLQAFALENSICFGKTTQLVATGAQDYFWTPETGLDDPTRPNPLASPAETTTYTLHGINSNGCAEEKTVTIEVTEMQAPMINMGQQFICDGDFTFLSAFYVGGAESYQWTPTEGLTNPTTSNTNANPSETTTYTVEILDIDGCISRGEVTIFVDDCIATSIEDSEGLEISVFPNPSNGLMGLSGLPSGENAYSLYNLLGQELTTGSVLPTESHLDFADFGAGIYFLHLRAEDQEVVKKIIIE